MKTADLHFPVPRLSVIIPLYNTEKYIEQCICSIVDSQIDSSLYEIIVVDDGSTDGSATIVERLCRQFRNIRLIRQENQGVSIARMKGVSLSKGEYIWFVDSDDWVVDTAVGFLLGLLDQFPEIDLFVAPMCLTNENGQDNSKTRSFSSQTVLSGKELLQTREYLFIGSPHFIIRRLLFDSKWLFFPTGIRYEDEYFCRVLKYNANQVLAIPQYLYYYRLWEGSHMHSLGIESAYDIVHVYKELDLFTRSEVSATDQRWFRKDILSFLFESLVRYPELQKMEGYDRFIHDNLPYIRKERRKHLSCLSFKDRLLSAWIVLAPQQYTSFMRRYFSFKYYLKTHKKKRKNES